MSPPLAPRGADTPDELDPPEEDEPPPDEVPPPEEPEEAPLEPPPFRGTAWASARVGIASPIAIANVVSARIDLVMTLLPGPGRGPLLNC